MRDGALVGVLGILIFDKRAFAIQVFKFGAFFLNEVRFAWLKVGGTDKLERAHVLVTYCMNILKYRSIFMELLTKFSLLFFESYI